VLLRCPVGGVFQAVVPVPTQLKMHTIPQRSVTSPDINCNYVSEVCFISGISGSSGKFEFHAYDNSLSLLTSS
jgi:hypothetical protein